VRVLAHSGAILFVDSIGGLCSGKSSSFAALGEFVAKGFVRACAGVRGELA
jgi:hypothetical protein